MLASRRPPVSRWPREGVGPSVSPSMGRRDGAAFRVCRPTRCLWMGALATPRPYLTQMSAPATSLTNESGDWAMFDEPRRVNRGNAV